MTLANKEKTLERLMKERKTIERIDSEILDHLSGHGKEEVKKIIETSRFYLDQMAQQEGVTFQSTEKKGEKLTLNKPETRTLLKVGQLFSQRITIAHIIGRVKKVMEKPAYDEERELERLKSIINQAEQKQLPQKETETFFRDLISVCRKIQEEIIAKTGL